MRDMFDAIINNDPLPGEKNADNTPVRSTEPSSTLTPKALSGTTTSSTPPGTGTAELVDAVTTSPDDVTVQVSNSTGQDGLGATAAGELRNHGFNVNTPDDYPNSLSSTTVFFSAGNEQAAATVASALPNPTMERVSGMGDVVQVVLGTDFYSVTSPAPSGSSVRVHVLRAAHGSSPTALPDDLTVTNAADTTCQ
jgi:LytR cell envelope-related transcriptional attenuator